MPDNKQYDPARSNENSPAPGFASVNTHSPEGESEKELPPYQRQNEEQSSLKGTGASDAEKEANRE
jgi:hypothetical protein